MRTLLTDLRGNPISITSHRSNRQANHKSILLSLVQTSAWTEVVRRATKVQPDEVLHVDEQGNTPLHIACKFDPPASIIKALKAAAPFTNSLGLTPLHVAASYRCNAKALQALIDIYPTALRSPSRRDRTPIHYACLSFRGLDLDAFEILLKATLYEEGFDELDDDGSTIGNDSGHKKGNVVLAWKDSTGNTPLALLFRRYRERVRTAIVALDRQNQEGANYIQNDLGHLWGKARLVVARMTEERLQGERALLGAFEDDSSLPWNAEQQVLGESKFRIVHASVGLTGMGCPPEMIRLAIAMYPHQVKEMDEDGNLPLHIAATAPSGVSTAGGSGGGNNEDDSSAFSFTSFFSSSTANATPYAFDKVIKILLRHYPGAALVPQGKSGRLPLVMAIRARQQSWDDGIQSLLTAYPPGLHSAKIMKIYPEVLALAGGGGHPIPRKVSNNNDTGGIRILQNLWLVAAQHRRERKERKRRNNGNNGSNHHKSKSFTSPQNVDSRALNTLYQLLKTRPDLVDTELLCRNLAT